VSEELAELNDIDDNMCESRRLKGWRVWLGRFDGSFYDRRADAAERLLRMFDDEVLDGRLGAAVMVRWNNRLLKTAGVTIMKRGGSLPDQRTAVVELSTKVVDDAARMYGTLAHELCHAAAWVLDGVARPPHGRDFKRWASVFQTYDADLAITVCHSYQIRYAFVYECGGCGHEYGRHSKSIDTAAKVCGRCKSRLMLRTPERVLHV
jgi:predicted SprT family Zn-dependent metalloprotease